jgi:outer membrane protein
MLKTRIILLIVSAIVIGLIFLLPKAVVENESQMAAVDSTKRESAIPAKGHSNVPDSLANSIKTLRAQYLSSSTKEKNAIFADSLRSLYSQSGQFDSAAWFADKAATFFNTIESYLKAGDSYFEAHTFALKPEKQKAMAEKTQYWLGKVIERNPKSFESRTKIGITYLSTSSPMKGIQMMREVLAEDPKNEFTLFNMGMFSIQSGQNDKAIERLNELLAVNPKHSQGNVLLGVAYLNLGNKDKARQQFEKVKKLDNDPAVQATVDSYLKDLK